MSPNRHSCCGYGFLLSLIFSLSLVFPSSLLSGQDHQIVWSDQEKPILEQLRGLRGLADDVRAGTTKKLAVEIRQLPAGPNKLQLAAALAGLSTEGDFGRNTLQEVTTTLASVLKEQPASDQTAEAYLELASLVRYEHMQASSDSPQFAAAMSKLEAEDKDRAAADFSLTDIQGKPWRLRDLSGKVVVVNFWATWCPPCRKEMPDLEILYNRFKDRGLVVLAISDEDAAKVKPFVAARNVTYPVLLDSGRRVNTRFHVEGIPKTSSMTGRDSW
ncbi:MAG TPA: TlpA disulfide reductase family protein [Candidatus Angelobacter sp.]|nr:TlpA disulfide reductase family protein [Candidatus Angelobacter sp.]